jgi:parallel beta-helix repeat protein
MATEITTKPKRAFGWLVGGLAVATLMSLVPARPEAAAPIGCGAALSGENIYVLTGNVGPCIGPGPAITVEGPATLKLNGWTVSCAHQIDLVLKDLDPVGFPVSSAMPGSERSVGIALTGMEAALLGAGSYTAGWNPTPENSVMGCDHNVVVEGEGKHEVTGVTSVVALSGAFVVTSNENNLTGNVVKQHFFDPDPNARPVKSGGTGFTIESDKNVLYRNVAADSLEHGFQIAGNENRVEDNIARDNEEYGFVVEGGGNRVRSNSSTKNIGGGFLVGEEGEGNRLSHNLSSENGDGDPANGFEVHGSNNLLNANTADHNGLNGIILTATAGTNIVTNNAVSRSNDIDLVDETEACGGNTWHKNIFGTKNRSCIR